MRALWLAAGRTIEGLGQTSARSPCKLAKLSKHERLRCSSHQTPGQTKRPPLPVARARRRRTEQHQIARDGRCQRRGKIIVQAPPARADRNPHALPRRAARTVVAPAPVGARRIWFSGSCKWCERKKNWLAADLSLGSLDESYKRSARPSGRFQKLARAPESNNSLTQQTQRAQASPSTAPRIAARKLGNQNEGKLRSRNVTR